MNSPFPSCLKPLFQSEAKCEAIDTKSCGELTHFHNKGFAICLVLKETVFGLNWKLLIQLLCHALKGCFYFPLVNNY